MDTISDTDRQTALRLLRAGAMRERGVSDAQWEALIGTLEDLGRAQPADLGLRHDGTSYDEDDHDPVAAMTRTFVRRLAACLLPDEDDTIGRMAAQVVQIIYPGRGEGALTVHHIAEVLAGSDSGLDLFLMRRAARLLRAGLSYRQVMEEIPAASQHLVRGAQTFLGIATFRETAIEESLETALAEDMTAAEAVAHWSDVHPDMAGLSQRQWRARLALGRVADDALAAGCDPAELRDWWNRDVPAREAISFDRATEVHAQAHRRARQQGAWS